MKDYRVQVSIRNNKLMELREQAGFSSASEACKACNVRATSWSGYESLKKSPYTKDGTLRLEAQRICDYFGVLPEDIFPEQPERTKLEFKASYEDLMPRLMVSEDTPETLLLAAEQTDTLRKMMSEILTPREEYIILERFGLGSDGEVRSLVEVGQSLQLSCERVRQIEMQGLWKLRAADWA